MVDPGNEKLKVVCIIGVLSIESETAKYLFKRVLTINIFIDEYIT
jgi:hypothetical protein